MLPKEEDDVTLINVKSDSFKLRYKTEKKQQRLFHYSFTKIENGQGGSKILITRRKCTHSLQSYSNSMKHSTYGKQYKDRFYFRHRKQKRISNKDKEYIDVDERD